MNAEPAAPGPVPALAAEGLGAPGRRRRFRAIAAFTLGLILLALALYVLIREGRTLRHGLDALAAAPGWMLAAALLLPLLNLAAASGSFWMLTGRYARVRYGEMSALLAAAWLLNHLPLRPGMLGRIAYHKVVHGIPIRSSLAVLFQALGCAGAAMGMLLLAAVVSEAAGLGRAGAIALIAAPFALAVFAAAALRRRSGDLWRFPAAAAFRYLDVCIWCIRYALVFALVERPLTPPAAAAIALSGQAAMLSPVQLGLREWLVGFAAAMVPGAGGESAALPSSVEELAPGLMVDVINRAAELSVAIPVGAVATAVMYRRFRRARADARIAETNPRPAAAL